MPAKDAMDHDNRALLSDATLSTLHLQHQPFTAQLQDSLNQDDEVVLPFSDSVTEEQLADIKQALITGDDLLLVLGEQGAGKSVLLQQLNTNSGLRIQCFPLTASERFNTLSLFSGMLAAFHQDPPAKLKDVLDELIPHLQSMVAGNTLCTIVLDDAHLVKKEELTQLLSGMLYMNSQDETLMRITLSANGEFEDTIPELLPEGADLPYSSLTVEGLSAPRAAAYIDYRLQLAGFDQEFPFTERDMDSLVEHSAGRPGQLHLLTADVLNEKYGRPDNDIPSELLSSTESAGFMQSRFGKLALGVVAILLIAGGLLMFLPNDGPATANLTATEDTRLLEEIVNVPDLQVIESQSTSSATREIAADATEAINDSVQNTVEAASEATTDAATQVPLDVEPASQTIIVAENAAIINTPVEAADAPTATVESIVDNTIIQSPDEPASEPVAPIEVDDTAVFAEDTVTEDEANAKAIAQEEARAALRELNEQAAEVQIAQTPTEEVTPASAPELLDDTLAGVLESPTWILVQDDEKYTIQLSASRDLDSIQAFLQRNPLPAPNSIFSFERAGEIWYALVHGSFDGVSEAQRAVERMPASAQRDQPWIRSIARVKAVLLQP